MLERWPQVCCVGITPILLLTNRFGFITTKSKKCLVNWIQLRIRFGSGNTQPHLKTLCFTDLFKPQFFHELSQLGSLTKKSLMNGWFTSTIIWRDHIQDMRDTRMNAACQTTRYIHMTSSTVRLKAKRRTYTKKYEKEYPRTNVLADEIRAFDIKTTRRTDTRTSWKRLRTREYVIYIHVHVYPVGAFNKVIHVRVMLLTKHQQIRIENGAQPSWSLTKSFPDFANNFFVMSGHLKRTNLRQKFLPRHSILVSLLLLLHHKSLFAALYIFLFICVCVILSINCQLVSVLSDWTWTVKNSASIHTIRVIRHDCDGEDQYALKKQKVSPLEACVCRVSTKQ